MLRFALLILGLALSSFSMGPLAYAMGCLSHLLPEAGSPMTFAQSATYMEFGGSYSRLANALAENNLSFRTQLEALENEKTPKASDYRRLVTNHHKKFFALLNDRKVLRVLREEHYTEQMNSRGALSLMKGRRGFEELSRANADRIRKDRGVTLNYQADPEIMALIQNFHLSTVRNSTHNDLEGPLLISSREINRYGLEGGLNSTQRFNKSLLQSDGDVFFHLLLSLRPKSVEKGSDFSSEYGRQSWKLNEDFARDEGWVSPFIMYAADLTSLFYGSPRFFAPLQLADEELSVLKTKLHRFDMTYSDFESLARDQLGTSLYKSKTGGYWESLKYERNAKLIREISKSDLQTMKNVINQLILTPLGLPKRMELKVPVAVPREALINTGI